MPLTINTPPTAAPERLSRLVDRINAGEIKIPKFQRGFVWKRPGILDLVESILEGYPIGSLLFWRTEEKLKSERDIGGFVLPPTQDKYPTNYVLDGQQRLTTIYGVLSYTGPSEESHNLNVVYDLRKKEVRHRQPGEPVWCMPLNVTFAPFARFNQFQQSLAALPDGEALNAEALRVNETFREYQVPVVTLTDRTLAEVSTIFERINSTGTKLTIYDLMVAATYSTDFDLNDEVEKLAAALKPKGFELDGDGLLRTVVALRGESIKKKAILALRDVPHDVLRGNLTATKASLERAIDFLRTEVGVVSSDFLPYEAQVIILSRVFSLATGPLSPAQMALLRAWFWLSSFKERYQGASYSIFDADLKRCEAFVNNGEPLIPMRAIEVADLQGREFRKGTALANAFVALLATNRPRSLADGSFIDVEGSLSWANQREFHHIFPKGYLATCDEGMRKRQGELESLAG